MPTSIRHPMVDVGAALAAMLAGMTFSQAVTVTRRALVRFDLKDLKTCQVSIVPADWDAPVVTRTATRDKVQIDVAVQQKVDTSSLAQTDALMHLVYEIEHAVKFSTLDMEPTYTWSAVSRIEGCLPGFAKQHLDDEFKTFTSIRRHTFVPGV